MIGRPAWAAGAMLGVVLLTGCRHQPVLVAVQPPPPPVMTSVPPPSHPFEPVPQIPLADAPDEPLMIPSPRRPVRRRPTAAASAPVEAAATAPPPMDLGNLTVGGELSGDNARQQTEELLQTQHRRLAGMSSVAAAAHAQLTEQVRLFLRQADEAWGKQDLEGARNLATKAKVLLDEIFS